ncbi:MAG: rhodanese-like domain-containing protein [Nocardioides sp.]
MCAARRSTPVSALTCPTTPRKVPCVAVTSPEPQSVPWARAANEDGTFKSRAELEAIYLDEKGLRPDDDVIAYCRIGERSSHTWFVLTYLLGFGSVRNYDGSWTEWGNAVRVPIAKGAEPGGLEGRGR